MIEIEIIRIVGEENFVRIGSIKILSQVEVPRSYLEGYPNVYKPWLGCCPRNVIYSTDPAAPWHRSRGVLLAEGEQVSQEYYEEVLTYCALAKKRLERIKTQT